MEKNMSDQASTPTPTPAPQKSILDNVEVVILIDTSGSMKEPDARPNSPLTRMEAVQTVINKFLGKRQDKGDVKPCCIIVFTDGAPDDPVGVASVIVGATKR